MRSRPRRLAQIMAACMQRWAADGATVACCEVELTMNRACEQRDVCMCHGASE